MPLSRISLTQEDGVVCQVFTKGHIVTADDPLDSRADDEGPSPLEYLLVSLGSSAAIALRRAGDRLALPIEEVQVSVQMRATHAGILAGIESDGPTQPIQREIRVRISRDISEFERDELLAAVKSSPLDRIIAAPARIEDALYILGYANPDEGTIVE